LLLYEPAQHKIIATTPKKMSTKTPTPTPPTSINPSSPHKWSVRQSPVHAGLPVALKKRFNLNARRLKKKKRNRDSSRVRGRLATTNFLTKRRTNSEALFSGRFVLIFPPVTTRLVLMHSWNKKESDNQQPPTLTVAAHQVPGRSRVIVTINERRISDA
jgi:hypothetical protein